METEVESVSSFDSGNFFRNIEIMQNNSETVRKVYDIDCIVKELDLVPHTYETILKELSSNKTYQFVLRKKLNKAASEGKVYKSAIPGTRFGKVIYFSRDKKYHVMVIATRLGSKVYYLFDYTKTDFCICVKQYWELDKFYWRKGKERTFNKGDIILWV